MYLGQHEFFVEIRRILSFIIVKEYTHATLTHQKPPL